MNTWMVIRIARINIWSILDWRMEPYLPFKNLKSPSPFLIGLELKLSRVKTNKLKLSAGYFK